MAGTQLASVTDLILDPFNTGRSVSPADTPLFLADPVGTLRRYGVNVPPQAEAPWRQFAVALSALRAASPAQAGSNYSSSHALYLDIHIPIPA